jgi:hypothetical protein
MAYKDKLFEAIKGGLMNKPVIVSESLTDEYRTYQNNPANAATVGWAFKPEYCKGDPSANYVTYQYNKGTFVFHNEKDFDKSMLKDSI